jgi:YD repeat-containing protein
MKSVTVGGTITSYAYDSDGQRVGQQTAGEDAKTYVNDKSNPTGYPQIIEENTAGTSSRSYVAGNAVLGQSDATNGTVYFIRDGHGSNRGLTDATGAIVTGEVYDYQGFGEAIGFTPGVAKTIHLFAGDAEFDGATGFYYHDARWRDTFRFTSYDGFEADRSSPEDLHKYLYTPTNVVSKTDPAGHMQLVQTLGTMAIGMGQMAMRLGAASMVGGTAGLLAGGIQYHWSMFGIATALYERNTSDLAVYVRMRDDAQRMMNISMGFVVGGLMLSMVGELLIAGGALLVGLAPMAVTGQQAGSAALQSLRGGRQLAQTIEDFRQTRYFENDQEAQVAWRVYQQAASARRGLVIGHGDDPINEAYNGWQALRISKSEWTPRVNMAWIDGGSMLDCRSDS